MRNFCPGPEASVGSVDVLTVDGVGEDPGADVEDEVIEAIEEAIEHIFDRHTMTLKL